MRIATWNVNSVLARLPRLVEWLEQAAPDVVCLQETKVGVGAFPSEAVEPLGYAVAQHGEGRWNGVAVLSRVGLADLVPGLPGDPGFPDQAALEARTLAVTCGPLRVRSVYVPNGRTPDDPHYAYKLRWLAALRVAVAPEAAGAMPFAVMGDFNIAPTDADVWDPAAFVGSTHVTPAERAELGALRETGLTDVVPRIAKGPHPFTYWDYRAGSFHKGMGMRIDLVYANPALAGLVKDAWVDREARKGKGPSDHAPVIVDLALQL
ncbi:MAG TPA: exodeoxyribonuclease III [Streptosporangiaceae bacterium]|nr:exodeoxyribonuclease III [Streptosporangiaceae bacterium]